MTDATPLSTAAQAVLTAWFSSERGERMLGDPACLAIAAELEGHHTPAWDGGPLRHWTPTPHTRQELRNIAAELEGGTSTGSTH